MVLKRLVKLFDRDVQQQDADNHLVVHSQDHSLNPKLLCKYALEVVRVLQKNNFEAYVVGGCVRDLLLGLSPKDFDVATNAKPNEIKNLFKRSRIVGRRFQIVHVQYGREIIEVTTFRSNMVNNKHRSNRQGRQLEQSSSGMLTRDNSFGSIDQDASRRDLSINALYYDPADNSLHDFSGGLKDLADRRIRIIGDPATRYREDPVRLLRVARFAAKLDFDVDAKTLKPIEKMAESLSHVSAPRMFDETLKLFMSGQGLASFKRLSDYGLFAQIAPQTHRQFQQGTPFARKLVEQAMINTDLRIKSKKRVTPAFIYAALLWAPVQKIALDYQKQGHSPSVALNKAANEVIGNQIPITAIPRKFTLAMREIWSLQLMLTRRGGNRAQRLMEHPRFRAAYDFVLLREQTGEDLNGLGHWWTVYQEVDEEERQTMVQKLPSHRSKKRGPRRRSRGKN
jgi:poly(A) polymerase